MTGRHCPTLSTFTADHHLEPNTMSNQRRSFLRSLFCLGDKGIVNESSLLIPAVTVLPPPSGRLNGEQAPMLGGTKIEAKSLDSQPTENLVPYHGQPASLSAPNIPADPNSRPGTPGFPRLSPHSQSQPYNHPPSWNPHSFPPSHSAPPTPERQYAEPQIHTTGAEAWAEQSLHTPRTPPIQLSAHPSRNSQQGPYPSSFDSEQLSYMTPSSSSSPNSPPHISQRFFDNATGFKLNNFEYHNHNYSDGPKPTVTDGWKLLIENTAPNALLNSDARHDPPRCDEDTRTEVTNEILAWVQDRTAPQRLLCMTGAAGAGKSALQQTIAERCTRLGIMASCFFFSATDGTRHNITKLVPTIAYQLGLKNLALRRSIAAVVEDDPLIFWQNLRAQLERLIVGPVSQLPPSDFASFPYALFIDGLDECLDERRQRELLVAIQASLLNDRTPFRIFIASRPELPIFEALRPGGHLYKVAYHLRLSDDYDATGDIRRTLQRRLTELGERRGLSPDWFSEAEIEVIVAAASGQYVYATTAIRYLSDSRGSPVDRLRHILSWVPGNQKGKGTLASLDLLYTNILTRAKEAYEAADSDQTDFMMILRGYLYIGGYVLPKMSEFDRVLDLEEGTHDLILCDLRSLITVKDEKDIGAINTSGALTFYHKSFKDFLGSEARCGDMYIPREAIQTFISIRGHRMLSKWDKSTLITALEDSATDANTSLMIVRGTLKHVISTKPPPNETVDAFILFANNAGLEENIGLRFTGSSHGTTRMDSQWDSLRDHLLPYVKAKDPQLATRLTPPTRRV
ncbi:hypothetical protein D9611_012653 [Ephemerocybe angulata]|uniref:Nephrocystin 3-like N-terminal domain-containing protein n=1 Tax=Ephemerocybe angulata TaxID=980116 RepID=A0A8H5B9B9_9AGAR|nr:hypothetical protein D9611_012653 [Tulosesus angulatus]